MKGNVRCVSTDDFFVIEIKHNRVCPCMLKIVTALNGREERNRSSVFMMSSFEINLVCELFMA